MIGEEGIRNVRIEVRSKVVDKEDKETRGQENKVQDHRDRGSRDQEIKVRESKGQDRHKVGA